MCGSIVRCCGCEIWSKIRIGLSISTVLSSGEDVVHRSLKNPPAEKVVITHILHFLWCARCLLHWEVEMVVFVVVFLFHTATWHRDQYDYIKLCDVVGNNQMCGDSHLCYI